MACDAKVRDDGAVHQEPSRLDVRQQLRQEKVQELVRRVSEHAALSETVDVGHAAFV
ncbi:unnamed protein product, partial [Urochloa humidicola]